MKDLIRKVLKEIKFKPEREKFKWRYSQTIKEPKKKVHISTFRTPTYKYIVNAEEYDNHFYLISFYPVLDKSFYVKQYIRSEKGSPFYDKYSFRSGEKVISPSDQERLSKMSEKEKQEELKKLPSMVFKIFSLIVSYMDELLEKDPLASFGYFGASDIKGVTNSPDEEMINTQRFRVYRLMLDDHFKNTHTPSHRDDFSGSVYVNNNVEKEFPSIANYGVEILRNHI